MTDNDARHVRLLARQAVKDGYQRRRSDCMARLVAFLGDADAALEAVRAARAVSDAAWAEALGR